MLDIYYSKRFIRVASGTAEQLTACSLLGGPSYPHKEKKDLGS